MESLAAACTLSFDAGEERLEQWRAFDADYALDTSRSPGILTVTYAKNDDSRARLHTLVAAEQLCCAFLDWSMDAGTPHLVLTVRGDEELLASLNLG